MDIQGLDDVKGWTSAPRLYDAPGRNEHTESAIYSRLRAFWKLGGGSATFGLTAWSEVS